MLLILASVVVLQQVLSRDVPVSADEIEQLVGTADERDHARLEQMRESFMIF
jgi:hypothetical protein